MHRPGPVLHAVTAFLGVVALAARGHAHDRVRVLNHTGAQLVVYPLDRPGPSDQVFLTVCDANGEPLQTPLQVPSDANEPCYVIVPWQGALRLEHDGDHPLAPKLHFQVESMPGRGLGIMSGCLVYRCSTGRHGRMHPPLALAKLPAAVRLKLQTVDNLEGILALERH